MLSSRNSDLHNHLSRRITKKHSGIHTVTPAQRLADEKAADDKRESPFGEFKYDTEAPKIETGYKSIFGL